MAFNAKSLEIIKNKRHKRKENSDKGDLKRKACNIACLDNKKI